MNTAGAADNGVRWKPWRAGLAGLAVASLLIWAAPAGASSPLVWSIPQTVDPHPDLHGPRAISCPTSTLCVAVDGVGNVLTSTNPSGGAASWSVTDIDGSNELDSVSCPTSSLCVAVDGGGNVLTSTNPTGGAGAWTAVNVDGANFFEDISCPSAGFCAAVDLVGNVLTSTNPTGGAGAWAVTKIDEAEEPFNALSSIACASASLCAASGNSQLFASSNPGGGGAAWGSSELDVLSLACPSTTLCVASGFENNVLTSTNPTGGAGEWPSTSVELDGGFALDLSCPSASLCVGVSLNGKVLTSTNPTGGTAAWDAEELDNVKLLAVSCTAAPFCVAIDSLSRIFVGTAGTGHRLTIAVHGTGFVESNGFGCFTTCSRVYPNGSHITLTAFVANGSEEPFSGWSGGGCAGTGPCEVTMNADTEVTATFQAKEEGGEGEEEQEGAPPAEEHHETPSAGQPAEPPTTSPPTPGHHRKVLHCRKGFRKKRVQGKARCVRAKKPRHRNPASSRPLL